MAKIIRVWKEKRGHSLSWLKKNLFYFERIKFQDGSTETKFNMSPFFIGVLIIILVFIIALLAGCCDPNKSVVTIKPFYSSDVYLCGYDTDCDSDIDYWQHYYPDGSKMGKPIYTKGTRGNNDYFKKW